MGNWIGARGMISLLSLRREAEEMSPEMEEFLFGETKTFSEILQEMMSSGDPTAITLVIVGFLLFGLLCGVLAYFALASVREHINYVRNGKEEPWNIGYKIAMGFYGVMVIIMLIANEENWEMPQLLLVLPGLLIFWYLFVLYFLPYLQSNSKDHPHQDAIFLVNLLAGWTIVGWVVALVWAYIRIEPKAPTTTIVPPPEGVEERLQKAYALYQQGVLTQEEFEQRKKEILQQ